MNNKIAVVLGSESDLPVAQKALDVLSEFAVPHEAYVLSAHRSPVELAEFALNSRKNGFSVIIAFAGMAAHLAGSIAAHTTLPVIAVPCKGGALDGLDALLASVQMPSGVPVATVALNGGANAALLAMQILGISDEKLAAKLMAKKRDMAKIARQIK